MAVDITYLVRVSTPVFHHSTDGYIGQRVTVEDAFSTYDEALQYCIENYNPHEVDYSDFDAPYAYITVDVTDLDGNYGHEYQLHELVPNSYYTGPTPSWDEVPF